MQDNVEINVTTKFLGKSNDAETKLLNVFSYTVNITNTSQTSFRLMSRYWLITDGNGDKVEVQGEGVVGKQPVIEPGETFSYTSASMIKTEVGTMEGFYDFVTSDSVEFKASIPAFTLAIPNKLH